MSLKAQCGDEDVDEDCEEDKDCGCVVQDVQPPVLPHVVQIVLRCSHRVAQQQTQN